MIWFGVLISIFSALVQSIRFGYSPHVWGFLGLCAALCGLMACADYLGSITGWFRGGYIDEPTPGVVLRFLFLLPIIGMSLLFIFRVVR